MRGMRWQVGVFLCAGRGGRGGREECGRRLRGFWDVSVVGGGRVVFFYAQDAAAEVEERSAGGGGAVFGGAMVGRLWGVWREVVLELALTPLAFFLWGMLCIALL